MKKLEWSPTLLEGRRVRTAEEAEAAVAALREGWRLPTVKELFCLVDHSREDPAIDTEKFPDTQSEPYWTSTPLAWDANARWLACFSYGNVRYYLAYSACVRACREVEEEGK